MVLFSHHLEAGLSGLTSMCLEIFDPSRGRAAKSQSQTQYHSTVLKRRAEIGGCKCNSTFFNERNAVNYL